MWKRFLPAMMMVLAMGTFSRAQYPDASLTYGPPMPEAYSSSQVAFAPPSWENTSWVGADFLLGALRTPSPPPLFSTSPAGTPRALAGVPGVASTTPLFPVGTQNDDVRTGFRLRAGTLLLAETGLNLEAGFMMLESQSSFFSAASDGNTILARPYTQAGTGAGESVLVAFPGLSSGNVTARVTSGNLYEANIGVSRAWCDTGLFRFSTLLGYRFYSYTEGLEMTQNVAPVGGAFIPGTLITSTDSFTTGNQFHGFNLGARAQVMLDQFTLGFLAQVAAGNLRRQVNIRGVQTVTAPGVAPALQPAGVYALASNSGTHIFNEGAFMPEFGVNLGWQATANLRLQVGYTLLILGKAATVGPQVDTVLNTNLLPPANQPPVLGDRPAFVLDKRDIWAHALTLGGELSW